MLARTMYVIGGLLALLAPGRALSWPVELVVPVEPGKERFQKLTAVDWVEVEDPSVASAEVLAGSNELLLTGQKPGRTLLLLYAEGRFAVWRLTVGPQPAEDVAGKREAARKACPDLKVVEAPERSLTATVKDAACRTALLELLRTDAYVARELELTFELPVLQAQLADLVSVLPAGMEARYSGAGVVLSGKATREAHHRVLWEFFRRAVGRVPLEDRVEVEVPAAPPASETTKAPPVPEFTPVGAPDAGTVAAPPAPVRPAPAAPGKRKPGR